MTQPVALLSSSDFGLNLLYATNAMDVAKNLVFERTIYFSSLSDYQDVLAKMKAINWYYQTGALDPTQSTNGAIVQENSSSPWYVKQSFTIPSSDFTHYNTGICLE
jgi:hypothetical protein